MLTNNNDNFSIGHVNQDNCNTSDHNLLDDGDLDDFSSTPNFDVYEKIEINHGMLVSTRQAPNTFYHKVVPSRTVQVLMNPTIMVHQLSLPKPGPASLSEKLGSFSRNMMRTMNMKMIKSKNCTSDQKEVEGGEVNNIKPYLTFVLALCAIWVQIVSPYSLLV